MDNNEKNLDSSLQNWRRGTASIDDVRSLALDIGAYKYTPAISALVELLDHNDELVRYNAAGSLATNFKYTPAAGRLVTMLASDPDGDCRSMAASSLATLCHDTKDREILSALAKSSLEDPDECVRNEAYRALLIVNGISREEHLSFFRHPPHVDPDRVRSILSDNL